MDDKPSDSSPEWVPPRDHTVSFEWLSSRSRSTLTNTPTRVASPSPIVPTQQPEPAFTYSVLPSFSTATTTSETSTPTSSSCSTTTDCTNPTSTSGDGETDLLPGITTETARTRSTTTPTTTCEEAYITIGPERPVSVEKKASLSRPTLIVVFHVAAVGFLLALLAIAFLIYRRRRSRRQLAERSLYVYGDPKELGGAVGGSTSTVSRVKQNSRWWSRKPMNTSPKSAGGGLTVAAAGCDVNRSSLTSPSPSNMNEKNCNPNLAGPSLDLENAARGRCCDDLHCRHSHDSEYWSQQDHAFPTPAVTHRESPQLHLKPNGAEIAHARNTSYARDIAAETILPLQPAVVRRMPSKLTTTNLAELELGKQRGDVRISNTRDARLNTYSEFNIEQYYGTGSQAVAQHDSPSLSWEVPIRHPSEYHTYSDYSNHRRRLRSQGQMVSPTFPNENGYSEGAGSLGPTTYPRGPPRFPPRTSSSPESVTTTVQPSQSHTSCSASYTSCYDLSCCCSGSASEVAYRPRSRESSDSYDPRSDLDNGSDASHKDSPGEDSVGATYITASTGRSASVVSVPPLLQWEKMPRSLSQTCARVSLASISGHGPQASQGSESNPYRDVAGAEITIKRKPLPEPPGGLDDRLIHPRML